MSVNERDRHRMIEAFQGSWGEEIAMIVAEHLPPSGWSDVATRQDLANLELRMDARFTQVDARFTQVDARFDQIEARFDARFTQIDARFETFEHRLLGEMDKRLADQTRAMIIAFVGSLLAFGTLVFAAAMFARP